MGIVISKVFASLFGSKEVRILILGLDNAGKTTILYRLQADEIEQTVPTIGFNMETLQYKNIKFQVWDLGGQTSIRPYWRCYYPNTDAIIYVVDSADIDRLNIAKQELHAMLEEEELKDSILLVFANKQDQKGALNAAQISEAMGLSDIRNRQWSIKETTATQGAGLFEGFDCVSPLISLNKCAEHLTLSWTHDTLPTESILSDSIWSGPPDSWPVDHCRVLYCISNYAQQAKNVHTKELWIRQVALQVLLYEGIESGVLPFDYAPNLVWLSYERQTERRWLRISQEVKSIVDDLWEAKLVNGIKLSSTDYQPITAYQASYRGLQIVEQIPTHIKEETHTFIYPPPPHERNLLHIRYNGEDFQLFSGEYIKVSGITECEDVSYVSSPYIPSCLRSNTSYRVDPTCNKLRAIESAKGLNMMIKQAKESVILSQVRAMVGEWLPFGANQIAALNERLGAMERCQGGLFSSKIDEHPTLTHFEVPPGLTQVKILDFDAINFINFEAEINFPEQAGVIQVENFGMHLNVSGALLYGVKIDAIMNRTERDIPFDLLARLLVDVHQDSSEIIRDLLSRYQLSVLEMLFMDKPSQRNKYNLIMSNGIEPKLPACKYLDKGDRENELKQVLGEIYACYDITRDDVLFLGRDGCLFCGPNTQKYEHLLAIFMGLNSREIFIRNFFVRTFVLDDTLVEIRRMIHNYRRHTISLSDVKQRLSDAARNVILLVESLQYLLESVEDMELPTIPIDIAGIKIFKSLSLLERKNNILVRCQDSIKLIERLRTQLDTLLMRFEIISKTQLTEVSYDFDSNIKHMMTATATHDQLLRHLEVVRMVFTGNLSFDIIDRLNGGAFHVGSSEWFRDWIQQPLIETPMVFFLLNLAWFCLTWCLLQYWLNQQTSRQDASIIISAYTDKHIHMGNLRRLISKKTLVNTVLEYEEHHDPDLQVFVWIEQAFPSRRAETIVQLVVDEKHHLLRSIRLQVSCPLEDSEPLHIRRRRKSSLVGQLTLRHRLHPSESADALTENNVLEKFTNLLRAEGVYSEHHMPLARLGTMRNLLAAPEKNEIFSTHDTSRLRRRRSAMANIRLI